MCDNIILWLMTTSRGFQKSLKSACQSEVESEGMNVSHISVQPSTCSKISCSNIKYQLTLWTIFFFVQVSQVFVLKTLANYSKTTSLNITCQLKSKSLITHLLPTNPECRRGFTITESSHRASASPFLAGISGVLSSSVFGVAWF